MGGGWGLLQVFDLFIERGFLPEWVFGGALLALLAGLPVVLTTAYVQGGERVRPTASPGDPELPEGAAPDPTDEPDPGAGRSEAPDDADGWDIEELFTWQKAITGGVLAFAFLGVLTAGYMVMRVTGIGAPGTLVAQGVFEEGAQVVLADFTSTAGEAAPGELITEALRIDLAQSTALRLMPNTAVNAALERMQRDPADGLPSSVALELATREGATAVITGEVGRLGGAIVINARLLSPAGDELASFRVTAEEEGELIDAIDDLSRRMREKVGESLRSVAASEPLEAVATSSLEALRRFTVASRNLDRGLISVPVAIRMFEEAVAIDSTFAAGHRALSVAINNMGGDRELAARSIRAAYRHRNRLPERERLFTEASYHMFTGDEEEAARAFRSLLVLEPGHVGSAGNLTHILGFAGRYEEVLEVAEGIRAWDEPAFTWNVMVAYAALGRREEALAVLDSFQAAQPDFPYTTYTPSLLLAVAGEVEQARTRLEAAPPVSDPIARAYEMWVEAVVHTLSGQLAAASEVMDGAERTVGEMSGPSLRLVYGMMTPWTEALIRHDTAAATREMEKLHREIGWTELSPYNRQYGVHALTWGLLGDVARAEAMLESFESVASIADPWERGSAAFARALVAARSNDPDVGDLLAAASNDLPCARCADFYTGFGHDVAGNRARAIEAYERYLRFPFFDAPNFVLHNYAPTVHEALGRLHEAEGDLERAAEHYRAFAEAWRSADPSLQPRVRQARERAEAIEQRLARLG